MFSPISRIISLETMPLRRAILELSLSLELGLFLCSVVPEFKSFATHPVLNTAASVSSVKTC